MRFAKPPANAKDLHRPLRAGDDLDDAFVWKEERTLSQALTLQYDKVLFIVEPSDQAKSGDRQAGHGVDHPDGRLSIRYRVSNWPTGPSTSFGRWIKARLPRKAAGRDAGDDP